jgi:hypothetical protein
LLFQHDGVIASADMASLAAKQRKSLELCPVRSALGARYTIDFRGIFHLGPNNPRKTTADRSSILGESIDVGTF